MSKQTLSRRIIALLGGVLLLPAGLAFAQDGEAPGIIRITAKPQPIQQAQHQAHAQHASQGQVVWGEPIYVDCREGKDKWGVSLCTRSPDHGWSHPQRRPIIRNNSTYQHFWPTHWYGTRPGGQRPAAHYPTVAMPTDTAQLGFYSQHVPHWVPNQAMLPPFPQPWKIHTRYCDYARNGGGSRGGWVCPECGRMHMNGEVIMQPGETIVPQADPNMSPTPQAVPPVPAPSNSNTSAGRFHRGAIIRR